MLRLVHFPRLPAPAVVPAAWTGVTAPALVHYRTALPTDFSAPASPGRGEYRQHRRYLFRGHARTERDPVPRAVNRLRRSDSFPHTAGIRLGRYP